MSKIKQYTSKLYLKIKPKKKLKIKQYIFVESFNGRTVGGNPYHLAKYIACKERLHLVISTTNKELFNKIHKVEIENELGHKVTILEYYINRLDYKIENIVNLASYVIVNNDIYVKKFKPQGYVIQTWHGTPLKKIGRDIKDWSHISTYIYKFESQLKEVDLLLSQNDYSKEIFYRAFNKIIEPQVTGYPKNDYLISTLKEKEKIKKELGYSKYSKIILYAPTWRDDSFHQNKRCYKSLLDYNKLQKHLNKDTLFLIKPHENEKSCILNESKYENIKIITKIDLNKLIVISDKLITDYSSIFFDYMLMNNRIDFYSPDYEKYKNKLRDMYFKYSEKNLPGCIYFEEERLYEKINDYKIEDEKKYQILKQKYLPMDDGMACKRIYEYILLSKTKV